MFVIILNQCILKKNSSISDKNAKTSVPYTTECEFQLDFRFKNKNKPWGVATIYHPTQNKNQIGKKNLKNMVINSIKSIN